MNEEILNAKNVELVLRDGKKYTVKPLVLNELIKIWPIISDLEKSKNEEVTVDTLKRMRELVHVALRDQVKDEEQVGNLVDMSDIGKVIAAVIGVNKDNLKGLTG